MQRGRIINSIHGQEFQSLIKHTDIQIQKSEKRALQIFNIRTFSAFKIHKLKLVALIESEITFTKEESPLIIYLTVMDDKINKL